MKSLSVKEFNEAFDCNVIEMMREMMAAGGVEWNNTSGTSASASAVGKKHPRAIGAGITATAGGPHILSMKTPAAHRFGTNPPKTMRTARRGEVIRA